jgi:creatinine amidohydrolase
MKNLRSFAPFLLLALSSQACLSQASLATKWEELTGPDFIQAIHQSQGVCVLPFGIIEKHGPHLPLGTDLIDVRYAVTNAVKQEYAIVFPQYYFGQIFEAKHQPGTLAYSLSMQLALLQETVAEMARNGCKKIVIVNGHGGNNSLLPLFAQSQLDSPRDYVVYVFGLPNTNVPGRPTWCIRIAPPSNPARISKDSRCQNRFTPAFGGMRVSPITMLAGARQPTRNWASSTRRSGPARLPRPSKPSRPTR